jgi:hypothetical protein
LESLPESQEEEEEERIVLVMSLFLDINEDESEEKDTAGTILASKSAALPVVDVIIPSGPELRQMTAVVTLSMIIVAKEKGSSKPIPIEDKGKGPTKIEETKKAIEDDTPLGEGPFDKDLGGRRYKVRHCHTQF